MYKSKTNYWFGGIHCKSSWNIKHRSLTIKLKCPADSYRPTSCAVSVKIRRYSNSKIMHKCYTFVNVTNRAHKTNRIASSSGLQWKIIHINQFCEPCFAHDDWHCIDKYTVMFTKWLACRWLFKAERHS